MSLVGNFMWTLMYKPNIMFSIECNCFFISFQKLILLQVFKTNFLKEYIFYHQ